MSEEEIEVLYAEPGESGAVIGSVSQERLEQIVLWDCIPASERKGDCPQSLVELASRVGVSTGRIRKLRKTARYKRAFRELLDGVALQMLPEVLFSQYKLAVEDKSTKAAEFIARQSEPKEEGLRGSGGNTYIQQNNTLNVSAESVIREDDEILGEVKALAKRGGLLRLLVDHTGTTRKAPPGA